MRFKSPLLYSRCTVIQCRDVYTRAKVRHTHIAAGIRRDPTMIYGVPDKLVR